MNEKMKELVAIGASVAGHCQPCLTYHLAKARDLGIDEQDIREAIETGQMVEKGAMSAMRDFVNSTLKSDDKTTQACCGGDASSGTRKCCG